MPRDMRLVPEAGSVDGQSVTFVLAIGAARQTCQLKTTFRTRSEALNYLHKNRKEFERVAREQFARREIDDGVIKLTML